MTTKAPSFVRPASEQSQERIAYAAVADLPAAAPHDLDRLGFCVWLWLSTRRDSLEESVRNAGVQLKISEQEALQIIRERLRQQGVAV